jgi:hypothetical protein
VIGAVALVAATGAIVSGAMAAGAFDPSAERQAYLDDAAKRLGVDSSKLEDALKGAARDRVDAALAAGRITKDEAQAMKDAIDAGKLPLGGPGLGFGFHHGRGFGLRDGDSLDAGASYLGLTETALRDQLRSGKSLTDIAKAQGKSVDGLKQTILSAFQSKLDQAVKDGRLTSSRRDQLLSDLESRLDELVNRTASEPPAGGDRGWGRSPFVPGGFHSSFPADAPPAALPTA